MTNTLPEHGIITVTPDKFAYDYGSTVSLLATPDTGYHFTGWTGDETSSDNPLSLTMTSHKSIEAHFELNTYGLVVDAGTGAIAVDPVLVSYPHGTTVTLSATPPAGYHFTEWTGDSNAVTASITITMDTSKTLSANYAINEYPLNISAENGSINATPVLTVYEHNMPVTLTATPDEGYDFTGWNGSLVSKMNPLTIAMDSTQTLQAHFMHTTHTLTLVSEFGNVNASPEQSVYEYGSIISLEATSIDGYHFVGWEGDVTTSTNPLLVTIRSDINLTASFAPNLYPLLIKSANGTVTVSLDLETYAYGTTVSLLAESNEHFLFGNWSGDVLSEVATQNPLIITIDSSKTLEAHYTLSTYTLMVSTEGEGMVHRLPEQESYIAGSTVTLTASPDTGWTFIGWSGDVNATSNPLVISLTADTSVVANFALNEYALTVLSDKGTVLIAPEEETYQHGATVTLFTTPQEHYLFDGWSGDVPIENRMQNPLTMLMNSTKTLQANFKITTYTLSLSLEGDGEVTSYPDKTVFTAGSTVMLLAIPGIGCHFIGTSDDIITTATSLLVTMTSDTHVAANFALNEYSLTVLGEGGDIRVTPELSTYKHGTTVTLTAVPNTGFEFAEWTGDMPDIQKNNTQVEILMDAHKSIETAFRTKRVKPPVWMLR